MHLNFAVARVRRRLSTARVTRRPSGSAVA